ncbi:MAG: fimbrial biogenesis outer membrane usher protein [Ramlibacter sp.]|nr:fimbrial biogenesis outer membrane usher protein [Ramlibacter sp.]
MRTRHAARLTLLPLTAVMLAAGCFSCALAQTPPPPSPARPAERLIPLEVSINGAAGGTWTLMERQGTLYAPEAAFDEWRVKRRAAATGVSYRGETWYPLAAVPGFQSRMNFANQSMELVFSPEAFAATRLASEAENRPPLSPVEPAAFANFDLNLTHTASRGAASTRELGALTELGIANRYGVLTSSFVGRNLASNDPALPRSTRRLETTFTRDFPDSNLTLRLGDSTTRGGMGGRPTYFGGIQLSRNFALTPGFVSQPIPTLSGTSSAPSTVELYVNDVLRQTSNVPTGPFAIDNFPLLTGSGQARLVVRDVLGRETVIVQPFFTHNTLLEQGLSDWSVDAGAVRSNLGINNADYGQGFVAGVWRKGLNNALTVEGRAELGRDTRGVGAGASFELPLQALGQAALGVSTDRLAGRGQQWLLGVESDSLRHGFSVHAEGASRNFRSLGQDGTSPPNRLELSASYSYSSERLGTIGVGLARIATYNSGTISTYSANYSVRVGERGALTFSASRAYGASAGTSFGATFTLPLGNQVNSSSSFSRRTGFTEAYTSISKGLSGETGLGWRALGGSRRSGAYGEAGVYYQGDKMLLTGDTSVSASQQTVRLGAQGGLVFMDGRLFRSRYLQDSFALVEVPGYPDVGVGFQGSSLTRTDENGQALLPRLIPYQRNSIRLDPTELPISAEIDNIEQITVPPWRSGVKVDFPVRSGRAALLKIELDDGSPAPAGAPIELVGDKQEFFVARRGEAFITGLQARNTLRLSWKGATCTFTVELPPGSLDDIARVGPLRCEGVKP